MSSKTYGIESPKGIIKIPSFRVKNYRAQHVIRVPYILAYCTWTKTVSETSGSKIWDYGIRWQYPGYEFDILDKP